MSNIIRRESYRAGTLVEVEVLDADLDTFTRTVDGQVVEQRPLTGDEQDAFVHEPSLEERLEAAERPDGVEPWVMPTGAHDAPNIGDHRWHDRQVWRSLIDGNTTEPGSDDRWWETVDPPAVPDKLRDPLAALRPDVEAAADVAELRAAVLAILDTLTGS